MAGDLIQVSDDSINVADDGIVVAGDGDDCFCGDCTPHRYIQAKKVSCDAAALDVDLWFIYNDDGTIQETCDGVANLAATLPFKFHIGADNYIVSRLSHISTTPGTIAGDVACGWAEDFACCVDGVCQYTYQTTYTRATHSFSVPVVTGTKCIPWESVTGPSRWFWTSGNSTACTFRVFVAGPCCTADGDCTGHAPGAPALPTISDCPDCTSFCPIYRVTLVNTEPHCGGSYKGIGPADGSWIVDECIANTPHWLQSFPPGDVAFKLYDDVDCMTEHDPQPAVFDEMSVAFATLPTETYGAHTSNCTISLISGSYNVLAFQSKSHPPATPDTCCGWPLLFILSDDEDDPGVLGAKGWSGGRVIVELTNCANPET